MGTQKQPGGAIIKICIKNLPKNQDVTLDETEVNLGFTLTRATLGPSNSLPDSLSDSDSEANSGTPLKVSKIIELHNFGRTFLGKNRKQAI